MSTAEGSRTPGPGWSTITSTVDNTAPRFMTTFDVWTSFSRVNVSFLVGVPTARGKLTTMTPVYALGSPVHSESLVTYPDINVTFTTVTGPTPGCKFTAVATAVVQTDCGRCTLNGGTVELYYWPSSVTLSNNRPTITGSIADSPHSTVLNGTTLYSPSVYISFKTAYATNSCHRVGRAHTGTMLALRPQDVSTQIHVGGPVYQSGANRYGAMNYADLTGLPPANVYESQPSCLMFGCATIYPSSYFPTLVVPFQMRSLDPAWEECDVGLDGLYDPPVALTPQTAMATPTLPSAIVISAVTAAPQSTRTVHAPDTTELDPELHSVSGTSSADDSTSLASSMAGDTTHTPSTSAFGTAAASVVNAVFPTSLPISASVIVGTINPSLSSSALPQPDPITSGTAGATSLSALRQSIVDPMGASSVAAAGEVSSPLKDPATPSTVAPAGPYSAEPSAVATSLDLLSVVMSAVRFSATKIIGTPSSGGEPEASLDALVPDAIEPAPSAVDTLLTVTATGSTGTRMAGTSSSSLVGGASTAAMSLAAAEGPSPPTSLVSTRATGPIDSDGGVSHSNYAESAITVTYDPSDSFARSSSIARAITSSERIPTVPTGGSTFQSSDETYTTVQLPVVTTAALPTFVTDGVPNGSHGSPSSSISTSGCASNNGVWAATKASMILVAYVSVLLLLMAWR
ncbi:hypothetical protein B0A54_09532 [Friedmanniomyces endolithicus]|uniref:Uncharacterized protein n=1 Tax=Friedmanniomyces endolithicus TaxID=329885 RepID=A0A4U0URS1_9PEZI|nr:hypothetical protein LTS09_005379 [Friedmanniomyces endolithicus]TKA38597.1 hypothetical protein B0A54_09532 [Friedmanniomyces endolithicus]